MWFTMTTSCRRRNYNCSHTSWHTVIIIGKVCYRLCFAVFITWLFVRNYSCASTVSVCAQVGISHFTIGAWYGRRRIVSQIVFLVIWLALVILFCESLRVLMCARGVVFLCPFLCPWHVFSCLALNFLVDGLCYIVWTLTNSAVYTP